MKTIQETSKKKKLTLVTGWQAKNQLYSETKKVKQLHSDIPNLKHKFLLSEPIIRKSTWKTDRVKLSYC